VKTKIIALLVVAGVIACALPGVSANETVPCEILSGSTFNQALIASASVQTGLTLYRVSYIGGELLSFQTQPVSIVTGTNGFSFTGDIGGADTVKFFLWNSNMKPYANPLTKGTGVSVTHTVTFKDWNGTVLDIQQIPNGGNAAPPIPPVRNGYVFSGWLGSYQNVIENVIITAEYSAQAGINIFSVTDVTGHQGNLVTVTVSLGGTVNTCGFDMRLVYDSGVLEYVSHDSDWQLDVVANHVTAENAVKFNYGTTRNRTAAAKIMEVTFRIKNTAASGNTTVSLSPVEVIFVNSEDDNRPNPVGFNLINGTVTIN
jgi:uncharacterized repeat protein (TIGR02543 family)